MDKLILFKSENVLVSMASGDVLLPKCLLWFIVID